MARFAEADSLRALSRALQLYHGVPKAAQEAHCAHSLKLAVAANFTTSFLARAMPLALARHGIRTDVHEDSFNQWEASLATRDSALIRYSPDVILLMLASPGFYLRPGLGTGELARRIGAAVRQARESTGAGVVVTLPDPLQEEFDQTTWAPRWRHELVGALEHELPERCVPVDLQPLVQAIGASRWYADRYWVSAKLPFHPDRTAQVARFLAPYVAGMVVPNVKLVITDLDGTLWGGVVGEDGPWGVDLDLDGAGYGYLRLQRYLVSLHSRGVLLAVCSKNNLEDVLRVFRDRKEMILREEHFASFCVNWAPKPQSVQGMLQELNLTPAGVVFLDNSPAEREEIRSFIAEITVPELPEDPAGFVPALVRSNCLIAIATTPEDSQRPALVQAEKARETVRLRYKDRDEYLAALRLQVFPEAIGSVNLDRVAQLIAKTNQFNLTSRRHGRSEVAQLCKDPRNYAHAFAVEDRFGPYGLTGVLIAEPRDQDGKIYLIDTWLLSCRVLQRGVEQRMFQHLQTWLRERGVGKLQGEFVRTAKNAPVEHLLPSLGFVPLDHDPDRKTVECFELALL